MDMIRKALLAEIETKADAPVVVTISTAGVDRSFDVVKPDGADLKNYLANPVVLWAHDRSALPIGKAVRVWTDANGIKAEVEFAGHPFAKEVEALVRAGIVRAASIGFRPLPDGVKAANDPERAGGLDFEKWELLEFSFVPVPANAEALVESKAARDSLVKSLTADKGPQPEKPATEPESKADGPEQKPEAEQRMSALCDRMEKACDRLEQACAALEEPDDEPDEEPEMDFSGAVAKAVSEGTATLTAQMDEIRNFINLRR